MGRDRNGGRWLAGHLARWPGLSLLSKALLIVSVLASLAVVAVISIFVYLVIGGYSGGSNPTSVTGLLFPIAFLFLGLAGVPSMLACGLLWAGYAASMRKDARRGNRDGAAGPSAKRPAEPG